MSYKVYILFSEVLSKFYVGVTQDVEKRLHEHLNPIHSKFTSKAEDWKVFLVLDCSNKTHALKVEKFIKKMKSKAFILSLKNSEEKARSIIAKFESDC